MNTHFLTLRLFVILILLFFITNSKAQQLCTKCFFQNNSIEVDTFNLIHNGSFENTTCVLGHNESFCHASYYDSCSVDSWTCTGGGLFTYSTIVNNSESTIVDGNFAAYFGNLWAYVCSSVQWDTACITLSSCEYSGIAPGYPFSELNYGGDTGVSLEQTVYGLVPGNTYVLEFWAGGETHWSHQFTNAGIFAVDVGYGKQYLSCLPTFGSDTGTVYLIEFISNSSSHTIKFTNWGHMCNQCTELIIDNVKLYPAEYLPPTLPNCLIGVDDLGINIRAEIYPSLFNNILSISVNVPGNIKYNLYEANGKVVLQNKFTNSTEINTSKLSAGIYFIELLNNETLLTRKKLIKY